MAFCRWVGLSFVIGSILPHPVMSAGVPRAGHSANAGRAMGI